MNFKQFIVDLVKIYPILIKLYKKVRKDIFVK